MGTYLDKIVQRKPMLASQETVSPTKEEAKTYALNSARSSVTVRYTPSDTSLWIR